MVKDKKEDPEVTLFGEIVSEEKTKKYNSDTTWGILLLFTGIVLLLNSLGIFPWEIWNEIFKFWPVLLVLAGIKILLGNNIVSKFFMLVINLTVFGSLLLFLMSRYAPQLITWLPKALESYILYWESLIP